MTLSAIVTLLWLASPGITRGEAPESQLVDAALVQWMTTEAVQAEVQAASRSIRRAQAFGLDIGLGAPAGMFSVGTVSLGFRWNAGGFFQAAVSGGASPLAAVLSAQVEFYPLVFWTGERVQPGVGARFHHFRFHQRADEMLTRVFGEALNTGDDDAQITIEGLNFEGVEAFVTLDVIARRGFHFQAIVGRFFQLTPSRGVGPSDGVRLEGWQAWTGELRFGRFWR